MLALAIMGMVTRRDIVTAAAVGVSGGITPAAISSPRVVMYGDINQDLCHATIQNMLFADAEVAGRSCPISLHIQSYGGELMPVMYVLDCMDELSSPVYTHIDGYAASAATLISVSGERRFMTKRSFALLHELRTHVEGTYTSVMTDTIHSQELMHMMMSIYLDHTRISTDRLRSLLREDRWLNSSEALALGIVDGIRL